MTSAQLHYTSAPAGPGPRFTYVDPGIPQGVLPEAEQLVAYEAPDALHGRPRGLPKALSFSELADGGRLLSRSVCTGGAGSRGGFHAHALYLPPDSRLPDGALPITAWESSRWSDSAPPPQGRPGPIDRFEPSEPLRTERLVGFARSRAGWLAPFLADLRAVASDPAAGRIVLVERDSADVARWIALACSVLPREQAHRLTFTTYARRPDEARQQIVGALPSSERVPGGDGVRVHDCTGRAPSGPVADAWADVCARVWLAGRPELLRDCADGLGALSVRALTAGVELRSDARAAAARWAAGQELPEPTLTALIAALSTAVEDDPEETAAVAALLERLDGRVPAAVSAPLAARALAAAVLGGGPVPVLRAGALTPEDRAALAPRLAPALRSALADADGPADGRPLALLRVADLLDVDCQDLLPGLADRLAHTLIPKAPEPPGAAAAGVGTPELLDAVRDHPALRIALFAALDALAAADPPAAVRALAGSELPVRSQPASPHLRMCVLVEQAAEGERPDRFQELLRTGGVSPHADPTVLRTALALVWTGQLPSGREARLLLNELGSDLHRTAGTRELLIDAALAAPADDPDAPALAADLLRCFGPELRPGRRAALRLLEFTGLLGTPAEGENWIERALTPGPEGGEPVPDPVMDRVHRALADRLVQPDVPESELYALARSDRPALHAAYARAGRSQEVGARLRAEPSYVAFCFCAWSAYPGTGAAWDGTGPALLDKVLRPAVKALSAAELAEVEAALDRAGRGKLDAFRVWNRPGRLGRLTGRLAGRGLSRRSAP
ncbi:GTPase-associated protein 1-related protein [Streptomyces sp. NPDC003832]